ncbi:hypothetical protein KIS4809_1297 [Bacillus sp. ZZV12-4809]|nr:hypothetical protein KIS4809_1297 [Bacillus sp. ZZV12-4809]
MAGKSIYSGLLFSSLHLLPFPCPIKLVLAAVKTGNSKKKHIVKLSGSIVK